MRSVGILLMFISFSSSVLAQSIEIDSICWDRNRTLKWSDFQGPPDTVMSIGLAGCGAALQVAGYWDKGLPNFLVTNYFKKNSSWTVDTTSSYLLQHEQLHFDIAEVHARKIRKAVDSLRSEGIRNFDPYSDAIQYLLNRKNEINSLYDEETGHSVYRDKQEEWNQKVRDELRCLKEYATKCN